jgi:subtilisin family serine protease
MKKSVVLSLLLLMCIGIGAQRVQKMSHDIRQLVNQTTSQVRRTSGVRQHETVRTMIRFNGNAETVMGEYGCKPITHIGDIYVADIPVSHLKDVVNDERVMRVENHMGGKLLMDVAPQWINTPVIYEDARLPQAFTGKGVILGIIDVGLEVTHPNFYNADGTELRITRFLDQFATDDEQYGQPIDLGREYTTETEIKGKGYAGDSYRNYHGTHCLGISAGSGHTTPYRGVAYEAELAAADSKVAGDSGFGSANELALMKYLFDYADERQMPCVITYSIGFNPLPDDCVLFEEGISQMVGPGHILVAAAGNQSDMLGYVGKPKGVAVAGTSLVGDPDGIAYLFSKDLFTLKIINKHKEPVDGSLKGDSLVYTPTEGTVEKQLAGKQVSVEKNDTCYTIAFTRDEAEADTSAVLLVIEGEDCFVQLVAEVGHQFINDTDADPRCGNATNDHNVGLPGCLPSVITVGALNTRPEFTNINGEKVTKWGEKTPEGTIAIFSSQGPTLDGRIKPDVVTPGVYIHASANSRYEEDYDKALVTKSTFEGREYPWIAISGTSMATPCMAGIVALWLQANPTLSPDDVKRVIRETSHPLGDGIPNNTYGYGLADAYAGLLNILSLPTAISDLSQHQPSALTIRPADGSIRLSFDKAPAQPFTVRVYSLSGQLLGEHAVRPTASTDYLMPVSNASGICVVQVNSPEHGVTGSELILTGDNPQKRRAR